MPQGTKLLPKSRRGKVSDELSLLLDILPVHIRSALDQEDGIADLIEFILDLGRPPEARFPGRVVYFEEFEVTREDLDHVVDRVGSFTGDNRAGIERTLHRISAMRNRHGDVVGLTCRVGRAITGTVDIIRDVIERSESLLLLGPPGVGKTTLLREAARVLADELNKRVVVVDTSNEIAGDGDVPHPAIGHARRMQVPAPELQHAVMIEAVENHMPEVIVIDEIGHEREAAAARTIAERGVQLVATAHGITLDNLLMNPTLSDLVGGIQPVTLGDDEARRRGTQKTILERKAPPTFDILVEIKDRNRFAIYPAIGWVVDRHLAGRPVQPEVRIRDDDGTFHVESQPDQQESSSDGNGTGTPSSGQRSSSGRLRRPVRIYPIGVSRSRLDKAIRALRSPVKITDQPINADVVLSLKAQRRKEPKKLQQALDQGVEFFTIKSNTLSQIEFFLQEHFPSRANQDPEQELLDLVLNEAEDAIVQVQRGSRSIELSPQNSYHRRLQHELIQEHGLRSESRGREPFRRVIVLGGYPEEVL